MNTTPLQYAYDMIPWKDNRQVRATVVWTTINCIILMTHSVYNANKEIHYNKNTV